MDDGLVDREHADVGISPAARIRAPDMRRILAQIRPLQRRGVARDESGKAAVKSPLQAGRDVIIADAGPDRLRDRLDMEKSTCSTKRAGPVWFISRVPRSADRSSRLSRPARRHFQGQVGKRPLPQNSRPDGDDEQLNPTPSPHKMRGFSNAASTTQSAKTRQRIGHDPASSSSPVQDREDRWRSAPPFPGNILGRALRG